MHKCILNISCFYIFYFLFLCVFSLYLILKFSFFSLLCSPLLMSGFFSDLADVPRILWWWSFG